MPRLVRLFVAAGLGLALFWGPALAQDIRINPVPPHIRPQWTPVPGAPQVYFAPNIPTDVFRYRGKYYFFWEGYLYKGRKPSGPWKSVTKVPAFFHEIDPAYFKTARKPGEAPAPPAAPAEAAPKPPTAKFLEPGQPVTPTPGVVAPGPAPPPETTPAAPEETQPPPKVM